MFLVVLQVASLPVHIGGGRLLPTSPKEGQTHQLAQVTLAHLMRVTIVGEMNEENSTVEELLFLPAAAAGGS